MGHRKGEDGQMEIQRRKNLGRSHNCCSPFSAKLKCGDCGEYFGSKVWHSKIKYKRTVWQCNAKFKGESRCATPHLYEQRIKELFLEAAGILMENREEVIGELPVDFNERLFHRLVDFATVYSDGRVVFTFRNGVEVGTEI